MARSCGVSSSDPLTGPRVVETTGTRRAEARCRIARMVSRRSSPAVGSAYPGPLVGPRRLPRRSPTSARCRRRWRCPVRDKAAGETGPSVAQISTAANPRLRARFNAGLIDNRRSSRQTDNSNGFMAHYRKLVGKIFLLRPLTATKVYVWISDCVTAHWNGRASQAPRYAMSASGGLGMPPGSLHCLKQWHPAWIGSLEIIYCFHIAAQRASSGNKWYPIEQGDGLQSRGCIPPNIVMMRRNTQ